MAKVSFSNQSNSYTTSEISRIIADLFRDGGEVVRLAGTFNTGEHSEPVLLLADSQDMVIINLKDDQPVFCISEDQASFAVNNNPDPTVTTQSVIENSFHSSYLGLDTVWRQVEIVACELRYL